MLTMLCGDKNQDTRLKRAELAGAKEPSRHNYRVAVSSSHMTLNKDRALRDLAGKEGVGGRMGMRGVINAITASR